MSIRIKIAKWLYPDVFGRAEFWQVACEEEMSLRFRVIDERNSHYRALRNIIALKTPGCAHVGKKMAEVAEAALHSQPPLKDAVKEKAQ